MARAVGYLCIFLLVPLVATSSPELQCVSPNSKGFKFSLLSSRNETGHWFAQVQLKHGAGQNDTGPWVVNIEQCEDGKTVLIEATVIVPPPRLRRPDYQLLPGLGYYKLHTQAQIWNESRSICLSEGSHLLVLHSAKEFTAVKDIWEKNSNFTDTLHKNYIWVGLHKGTDGTFVTDSGLPLNKTGYEVWEENEPNNAKGNESCLSLNINGGLNDEACEVKLAFICEQEL